MKVLHNNHYFEIVRYYDDKVVISISKTPNDKNPEYITELVHNITTNFGGGFEEWVKDNF